MDPTTKMNEAELLTAVAGNPISQTLLARYGNLPHLAEVSFGELVQGVGVAQATLIRAAFQLGRRGLEAGRVDTAERAVEILRRSITDFGAEEFWCLSLDRDQKLIGVDPTYELSPEVVLPDLPTEALCWILAHSHPWGDPRPSDFDIQTTERLAEAAERARVPMLDHLILAEPATREFCSLRRTNYWRKARESSQRASVFGYT